VLRVPQVGITDNFFDLGGSSLSVLKLLAEMKSATGLEIGLDAVFRFPTIEELVESLGAETTRNASALVPLQPEGSGPPVFCLGGINIYREFAQSLGSGQPVYAVYVAEEQAFVEQASRGVKLNGWIDRLAEAYLKAIVRAAPQGPYRLAGISFGGVVAVEVASKLRRQSAEVECVMLLDTVLPHGVHKNWLKWGYLQVADLGKGNPVAVLGNKLSKLWGRLVRRRARGVQGAGTTLSVEEAFEVRQQALYQAIGTWDAKRLLSDFEVILFRASGNFWGEHVEFEEDYGWCRFLGRPLRIVHVAGDHLGIIQPPQVADLGRIAQQFLR
jgi:thioesterase domain-containing protein/acyl carrier protein